MSFLPAHVALEQCQVNIRLMSHSHVPSCQNKPDYTWPAWVLFEIFLSVNFIIILL